MRKIIILSAATLVLSSCGIYNKYKPVSEVPEGLYGSESVALPISDGLIPFSKYR